MKKNVFITGIAAIVLVAATACSKEYKCHCVYQDNGVTTHEDDNTISEGSKDKSSAACKEHNASTTYTVGGIQYISTTTCELKD